MLPRPRTLLAPLLAVVLLAAATTARAAAPWSPPEPIRLGTTSPTLQGRPGLAANEQGLAVAYADSGGAGEPGPHTFASAYTNGIFVTRRAITPATYAFGPGNGGIVAYAKTRLIGAGVHFGHFQRVDYAFGRLTPNVATLGRMRGLGPARMHAHGAAIAVNRAGDAAIAYPVCRDAGCTRTLVYLAVRRAGGSSFSSTRLYDGGGPLPRVGVAVNARGDAVAVWTAGDRLDARIRTAGGRLRDLQRVGATARGQQLPPVVALSPHRAELVGWVAQSVGEGDTTGGVVRAAKARDGASFTAVDLSSLPAGTGRYVSEAGIRVAFDSQGRSLLAYTAYTSPPGRFEVRVAELAGAANNPQQNLSHVQTASDPAVDTILGDLVVGPGGGELALMLTGIAGNDPAPGASGQGIQAAVLTGGPAGPVTREQVAATASGPASPLGLAVTRLSTGRALASWTTLGQDDEFSQRTGATLP